MTYLYDRIINVTFTNIQDTEIAPSGVDECTYVNR